jgi:predicted NAD/FAD-binding protein
VQVLTHTDASLMPARRRDWSPVNLWVDPAAGDGGATESTIWVNAVQPVLRGAADVFQTVPLRPVDPARVLGEARFDRAVVDARSQQALARAAGAAGRAGPAGVVLRQPMRRPASRCWKARCARPARWRSAWAPSAHVGRRAENSA